MYAANAIINTITLLGAREALGAKGSTTMDEENTNSTAFPFTSPKFNPNKRA
jgi:hypothetical protein